MLWALSRAGLGRNRTSFVEVVKKGREALFTNAGGVHSHGLYAQKDVG
jgi:hypothetical protein